MKSVQRPRFEHDLSTLSACRVLGRTPARPPSRAGRPGELYFQNPKSPPGHRRAAIHRRAAMFAVKHISVKRCAWLVV